MRIEASYDKDDTKSNTAKIIGNSAYGKFLENGITHSSTKIIPVGEYKKYKRKKTFKDFRFLDTEAEISDFMELNLDKRRVEDSKPVHVGNAILMYSKLHFLEFIEFLRKFLMKGSYRLIYSDTG